MRKSINTLSSSLEKYYSSGLSHKSAGDSLSDAFSNVAKTFKGDDFMEEPFNKVPFVSAIHISIIIC